jgi:hypothetical protein
VSNKRGTSCSKGSENLSIENETMNLTGVDFTGNRNRSVNHFQSVINVAIRPQ